MIGRAAIDEIEATERPGQQIDLDTTFQPGSTAICVVATATPGATERVGQANRGAIVDADTGEALENRL